MSIIKKSNDNLLIKEASDEEIKTPSIAYLQTQIDDRKILQVKEVLNTTLKTTTSISHVATGITATITPSAIDSKILIMVNAVGYTDFGRGNFTIYRDGTTDLSSTNKLAISPQQTAGIDMIPMQVIDSPATISEVEYEIYFHTDSVTWTVYLDGTIVPTSIILMEVAG